jgi:hypothetical protein
VLKYRGDVVENGIITRSKDLYKKLVPIDREHQPKNDGAAPDSVLAERDLFMATFDVENSGAQSMDLFKTYLESYLATGKGPEGPRKDWILSLLKVTHPAVTGHQFEDRELSGI